MAGTYVDRFRSISDNLPQPFSFPEGSGLLSTSHPVWPYCANWRILGYLPEHSLRKAPVEMRSYCRARSIWILVVLL